MTGVPGRSTLASAEGSCRSPRRSGRWPVRRPGQPWPYPGPWAGWRAGARWSRAAPPAWAWPLSRPAARSVEIRRIGRSSGWRPAVAGY